MKGMLEYKCDFFIGAISTILMQLVSLSFIWVIFENISTIQGWTYYEIVFIYANLTLIRAINHLFFDNLWIVGSEYIKEGKMDIILLKPIPPFFHIVATKIQKDGAGDLLIAIVLITKALQELSVKLTVSTLLMLIMMWVCGITIMVSLNVIGCSFSFWTIESTSIMRGIYIFSDFALYPINIFNNAIKIIITWCIPYAFISYYPASLILNKDINWVAYLTPVVALIVALVAVFFWKKGLKQYESTGS